MISNEKGLRLLGLATRTGKVVSGSEAVEEAINRKRLKLVIVADDCSEKTKKNLNILCERNNILICIFSNIQNLSKSIGKENRGIVGVKDKNLANEIYKIIYGGETIGEN